MDTRLAVNQVLQQFYFNKNQPLYVLVDPVGILYTEGPPAGAPKEQILRIFNRLDDVYGYLKLFVAGDLRVTKTSLVGLFSLIEHINSLCVKQFKRSLRIELCYLDGDGSVATADTLYSVHASIH